MATDARAAALDAHRQALDDVIELLDTARVRSAENRRQYALLSLAARAIQLQRTVHDAAAIGYADDELTPVARAMLSTLVTLAYIGRGRSGREREARALAWTVHQRGSQEHLYEYLWRSRQKRKADMDAQSRASEAGYKAMIDEAATRGITPAPKLGRRPTWTGLSDLELFRRAGYFKFYRHYYAPWSDESHAGPTTLNAFLDQARTGTFGIGPRERNPWFVLFATARFGFLVVGHLNAIYRLGQDAAIHARFERMQTDFSAALVFEREGDEKGG